MTIEDGLDALRAGDWGGARIAFTEALPAPEAEDGLGTALWWLDDLAGSHAHKGRAFEGYRRSGRAKEAALVAAWLAREQVFLHGDGASAEAWFARADGCAAEAGAHSKAWVDLLRASLGIPPRELREICTRAETAGRDANDHDLEAVAVCYGGLAAIAMGDAPAGMRRLDEAMTAVMSSEVTRREWMTEIFCVMLAACERLGDYRRADHWCRVAASRATEWRATFLGSMCRATLGSVLAASGRWTEAEGELHNALEGFERGHRALRMNALSRLAELHLGRGRLAEAERLMEGLEDNSALSLPLARLRLLRGELEAAKAQLSTAIQRIPARDLAGAPYHSLMAEVALATADEAVARRSADELRELAALAGTPTLEAESLLCDARLQRDGDPPGAASLLLRALDVLRDYDMSWLAARIRLELADGLIDPAPAVVQARAALATFERLGAGRDADRAAHLLRRLGHRGRPAPRLQADLTRREAQVLALLAEGLSNAAIGKRLYISGKTAEHHVSSILGKLGLSTRAEAAAYASSRGMHGSTNRSLS